MCAREYDYCKTFPIHMWGKHSAFVTAVRRFRGMDSLAFSFVISPDYLATDYRGLASFVISLSLVILAFRYAGLIY